jgi:hypothetical protein
LDVNLAFAETVQKETTAVGGFHGRLSIIVVDGGW